MVSGSPPSPASCIRPLPFSRWDSVGIRCSHPLDGFGFLTPEVERRRVLGVMFSSSLFPDRAPEGHVMLTAFVGGTRDPDFVQADPQTLTSRVLDDLRPLLGTQGEPTFRGVQVWPKAIPQYILGYGRFKEIADEVERRNPGLCWRDLSRRRVARRCHRFGRAAATRVGELLGIEPAMVQARPVVFLPAGRIEPRRSAFRIGTRGSALAVWQTEWVRSRSGPGYETERVEIKTTGDLVPGCSARPDRKPGSLHQTDRRCPARRPIDLAVHSFKDLPRVPDGISVAAVGEREDPRDALVGPGPAPLGGSAPWRIVATSSLRRRAQLLQAAARPPDR